MASVFSRYIARRLLARAGILLFGLAALMMLLDFLANGDQVIAGSDSVLLPILRYTVLRLPEIVAQLLPITAMLAGLLTFAELARHSELTAMAAAGVSKARLAAAVLPVAVLIAVVQFLIEDQAVPVAVGRLRAWGIGDYAPAGDAEGVWLRHGDDILRLHGLDPAAGRIDGVTVFQRDPDGNLVARLAAPSATYEDGGWTLHDVTRTLVGPGVVEHQDRLRWSDDLDPKLLASVLADPRETPLSELLRAIRAQGLGTQPSLSLQALAARAARRAGDDDRDDPDHRRAGAAAERARGAGVVDRVRGGGRVRLLDLRWPRPHGRRSRPAAAGPGGLDTACGVCRERGLAAAAAGTAPGSGSPAWDGSVSARVRRFEHTVVTGRGSLARRRGAPTD